MDIQVFSELVLSCSIEMEAYVYLPEEAQAQSQGEPKTNTSEPLHHVSSELVFISVRWGQLSLICLLCFI